jgi:16S rRNA (uracil1498-N3)-methyltransferase
MSASAEQLPRFYVPALSAGQVAVTDGEAHHGLHVLRLAAGAAVELFDGQGHAARATVVETTRHELRCQADPPTSSPPPTPPVTLAFAVPKAKRLDWLLEKATELGVRTLQPVIFERSVAGGEKLSASKRERWIGHCISAAKQCGLNHLPTLAEHCSLEALLAAPPEGLKLLGDGEAETPSLGSQGEAIRAALRVTVLVGPEGGLSGQERSLAVEGGFQPVRLGETTLRVETAAVALLAALRTLAM